MPFIKQSEIDHLKARIETLEAEIDRLRIFEDRFREDGKRKRVLEEKQRKLLHTFFNYKNYHHCDKRAWPEIICNQCAHCAVKPSPTGKSKTKYRCRLAGSYCSKYGSCDAAKPKKQGLHSTSTRR